ncbi:MAG: hypothetical protein A3J75_03400 [Acidobacteria bacterium RBG_16_68_9]|nr:MAG: hypothetical protein A3J75_03400 [Acidobacteria bacterium RBG_16_68_9]
MVDGMLILGSNGFLVQVLLLIGLLVSAGCYLLMLYSGREFFSARRRRPPVPHQLPPVTVLKPLKGLDVGLHRNLASLCEQDYGPFQIVFGVADGDDPAAALVRRLQAEYPQVDITLVVDARAYGTNYKVSNLHNMYRSAQHDVIVIADSDIRVQRDYLRRLVGHLQDPKVGLVTCLYRATHTGGLPTLMETLFINTDFANMVLVARKVERAAYAFGATIAIRRAVLDEIGGFLPLASQLADDYHLGYRVTQRGYEIALADQVVDTVIAVGTWQRLLQHQLRWARTYRICRPGGYFGTLLTHGPFWALLNVIYHDFSPLSGAASLAVVGLRYASAAILCRHYLRTELSLGQLLLVGPKDLLVSAVWFLAFLGDTVWWSGRRFRVQRNGEMIDVTPGLPVPAIIATEPGELGTEQL